MDEELTTPDAWKVLILCEAADSQGRLTQEIYQCCVSVSEEHVQVVRAVFDAEADGRIDDAVSFLDAEVELHGAALSRQLKRSG